MAGSFPTEAFIAVCAVMIGAVGFFLKHLNMSRKLKPAVEAYVADMYERIIESRFLPLFRDWLDSPMAEGLRTTRPTKDVISWFVEDTATALQACSSALDKCACARKRLRSLRKFEVVLRITLGVFAFLLIVFALLSLWHPGIRSCRACYAICGAMAVAVAGYVTYEVRGSKLEAMISDG